jgi:hypothetical protein
VFELILQGRLLTPMITKYSKMTIFNFLGCRLSILKPKRRYVAKLTVGKPMFPYAYESYLGNLELKFRCKSKTKAETKLTELLDVEALGLFTSEGLGVVEWLQGYLKKLEKVQNFTKWKKKCG